MRATLIGAALLIAACSSSDPVSSTACVADATPAGFSATTPVHFTTDVFPIFGQSCAFSTCHGATSGSANGIYLGGTDASAVHANLVGVSAVELSSMPYVTAGEPQASFLLRKLDGSQCALDCGGSCGENMPRTGQTLPDATRNVIRSWIVQGAKND